MVIYTGVFYNSKMHTDILQGLVKLLKEKRKFASGTSFGKEAEIEGICSEKTFWKYLPQLIDNGYATKEPTAIGSQYLWNDLPEMTYDITMEMLDKMEKDLSEIIAKTKKIKGLQGFKTLSEDKRDGLLIEGYEILTGILQQELLLRFLETMGFKSRKTKKRIEFIETIYKEQYLKTSKTIKDTERFAFGEIYTEIGKALK